MPRKALRVQIKLDVQAVTCPGVWLCPNGKVSLQIYMLDSCTQTTALPPVFPLLYHEQFIFYKTFYSAHTLMDLQKYIDMDFLYAELVQWQKGEIGNVIASFQTSLHEVLYPSVMEGTLSGVDVDLLMQPSKIFPGIIAPKIEISTRTTVEEILCTDENAKSSNYVVNPKTIPSNYIPIDLKRKDKLPRQKKVCHTAEYHRSRRCVPNKRSLDIKPPFVFKKADEELISRKVQGSNDYPQKNCKCRSSENAVCKIQTKKLELSPKTSPRRNCNVSSDEHLSFLERKHSQEQKCSCGGHSTNDCLVCEKYSNYFNGGEIEVGHHTTETITAFVRKVSSDPFNKIINKNAENTVSKNMSINRSCFKSRPASPNSYETKEMREFDSKSLSRNSQCDHKFCVRCSETQQPSVAKQIHNRLVHTLDFSSPASKYDGRVSSSGNISACYSPKFRNCDQGFYKNLGKFYKELYRC